MSGIHDCKIEALQDATDQLQSLSVNSSTNKFIEQKARILSYIGCVIDDLEVENE